jgi:hypothetical protein
LFVCSVLCCFVCLFACLFVDRLGLPWRVAWDSSCPRCRALGRVAVSSLPGRSLVVVGHVLVFALWAFYILNLVLARFIFRAIMLMLAMSPKCVLDVPEWPHWLHDMFRCTALNIVAMKT